MSRKPFTGLPLGLISLGQVWAIQGRLHLKDIIFWNGLQGAIADFISGISLWCLMLVMPVVDYGTPGAHPEPALLTHIWYLAGRCSCRKCWTTFSRSLVTNSHFTHWNILLRREEEVKPTVSVNAMRTATCKRIGESSHPTWGTGDLEQELSPVHVQIVDIGESLCLHN